MKDVSRREFLKTLCLGITVAALQNLPMTTAFADSAISKTKIISKSDRENLVATVARTVQVSYKIDKNTIIEVTRFTDIDGQNVTLNRSVKEDGTGELVYTKAQKTKKSKLTNQSYDVFLKLATSKSMPQTRGATVGSDVTGSQYKHIFVSNLSYTIDNTAIAQIGSCRDDRMEFNKLIPELTVKDIKRTREFYLNILQFKIEYERVEDKFMFLSFEDSQFMFEELRDDGWNVAEMAYPFGRGVNFSIEVNDIDKVYQQLIRSQYPLFREMMLNKYESNGELIEQKEFLVQDPDGYLLRFTHE